MKTKLPINWDKQTYADLPAYRVSLALHVAGWLAVTAVCTISAGIVATMLARAVIKIMGWLWT